MSSDHPENEPSERSGRILRVLVDQYIRDGQPVGSRTLANASRLDLSSATIRNVMADLEDLGFIVSPHTSAGRIPTAKGYRFFVDTLLKLKPPAAKDIDHLQHQLSDEVHGSAKEIASTASSVLSSLTSLAGVVTIPRQTRFELRQVEFLPLSDRRVLAILIINNSEVENRILDVDRDYSADELRRAANYLNDNFAGKSLDSIRAQIVASLSNTRETMNQMMIDAIGFAQMALNQDMERPEYVMSGETKLMEFNDLSNIDTLRQLFDAFNQQREILHLLDRSIAAHGVQIFIGEESGYSILDECSVVAAPYRVDEDTVGVLGVIGPTRMAYERIIPIVDITAKLVGLALNSGH
jgi:heat-inducible transcriptional repressor